MIQNRIQLDLKKGFMSFGLNRLLFSKVERNRYLVLIKFFTLPFRKTENSTHTFTNGSCICPASDDQQLTSAPPTRTFATDLVTDIKS